MANQVNSPFKATSEGEGLMFLRDRKLISMDNLKLKNTQKMHNTPIIKIR